MIKAKVAAFFALHERQEQLAIAISTAEKSPLARAFSVLE
ncbi:hypothetical protein P368_24035 [Comamonas thiooxydans]|uniref:Uncharacterized protein n=1 Tax=Comamonas thiooxydans TaxID=363952 RepID=A0A096DXV4_9BURK|nr:hypothetical protein P369_22585 [Comamonas thiooxydans]KGG94273.1 hypothetical protein P367_23125 [Comamonas thiooxydans]KGG94466.1 hypothetical protein P245_07805 [Comamonas thiooxydans]KGG99670.1 hypothetical protein P365_21940 [Comamonas thiooxydans]KGH04908.1 hypothetical protein P368_24035 [Comamonas thiooxydans]